MSRTVSVAHALPQGDRDVIDFFAPDFQAQFAVPAAPGAAYDAAALLLGISLTTAAQSMVRLLDDSRALNYRPAVIMQLRRQRDARSDKRLARRRLSDVTPAKATA